MGAEEWEAIAELAGVGCSTIGVKAWELSGGGVEKPQLCALFAALVTPDDALALCCCPNDAKPEATRAESLEISPCNAERDASDFAWCRSRRRLMCRTSRGRCSLMRCSSCSSSSAVAAPSPTFSAAAARSRDADLDLPLAVMVERRDRRVGILPLDRGDPGTLSMDRIVWLVGEKFWGRRAAALGAA